MPKTIETCKTIEKVTYVKMAEQEGTLKYMVEFENSVSASAGQVIFDLKGDEE